MPARASGLRERLQRKGNFAESAIPDGMHFHDLRAKALTDLKRQRGAAAAQSLAGHTTESMTAHYTKSREVERVQPVPLTRAS
ncbi:tyrosine-type recombinase/integrase [Burkholderia territorii]|uniref:tyrosine-type recombinase/integrase n=1 Tax=Burkholderia territorii TaxID=1503055 RepID=UPI002EDA12F4